MSPTVVFLWISASKLSPADLSAVDEAAYAVLAEKPAYPTTAARALLRDYGVALFKIKLAGDAARDVARLRAVARVIGAAAKFTL